MKSVNKDIEKNFLYENRHNNAEQNEDMQLNFASYQIKTFTFGTSYFTFPSDSKVIEDKKLMTFKVDHKFDIINDTWLEIILPEIRVRKEYQDKYRIRYSRNLGHNIIEDASLYFNNTGQKDLVQRMSGSWLNHYSKLFLDPQKYKGYDYLIGNRDSLRSLKTYIQRDNIIVPQPWFMTMDKHHALRLYLCKNTDISFEYKFRNDLKHLLQMYKKDDKGNFVKICYDPSVIEILPYQNTFTIGDPILKGQGAMLTREEKDFDKNKEYEYEPRHNLFITDYYYHTVTGGIEAGHFKHFEPKVEMCEGSLGFVMSAQNRELLEYLNYYDIYTVTESDSTTPLEYVKLSNSNDEVKREADPINQGFDTYKYSSSNNIPNGIWFYGFGIPSIYPNEINGTLQIPDVNFIFNLKISERGYDEIKERFKDIIGKREPSYYINIYFLVLKHIQYNPDEGTIKLVENKRNNDIQYRTTSTIYG